MTTVYSTMNLRDLFAELIVKPTSRLMARADVRRVRLASAKDLWYAGRVVAASFPGRWLRFFYAENVVQW
jgi:hypothetical protein